MEIEKLKAFLFMKGHSDRVPGKNMKNLCGRPLFHWIIKAYIESKVVSEIIINTDSEEIANNAKDHFDVTIHMRPEYLLHIDHDEANKIMAYDLSKIEGEYFIQSHSTNPLVEPKSIKNAAKIFFDNLKKKDSLISVEKVRKRLYRHDGAPINHDPMQLIKTQELPPWFEENSCIYIFSRESFYLNNNRIGNHPILFPMNHNESIDIDEEIDFVLANILMRKKLKTIHK